MQDRWGVAAASYLTSEWHSNEGALRRMVEFIAPQGGIVLDVATGAGHAAFAISPHVDQVIATDRSQGMLDVAIAAAAERGLDNISFQIADAHELPFDDGSMDGIVCRVAAHHFEDVPRFLHECRRVLRSRGWFAVIDTVGSDDPVADASVHRLESLRDPSHVRNYTVSEWRSMAQVAGFLLDRVEVTAKPLNAKDWMDRQRVPAQDRIVIAEMIESAEGGFRDYLLPIGEGDDLVFHLCEAAILMR
jgi:SAM-dependent methyltransferase